MDEQLIRITTYRLEAKNQLIMISRGELNLES